MMHEIDKIGWSGPLWTMNRPQVIRCGSIMRHVFGADVDFVHQRIILYIFTCAPTVSLHNSTVARHFLRDHLVPNGQCPAFFGMLDSSALQ
jgi:hypothetical protein